MIKSPYYNYMEVIVGFHFKAYFKITDDVTDNDVIMMWGIFTRG